MLPGTGTHQSAVLIDQGLCDRQPQAYRQRARSPSGRKSAEQFGDARLIVYYVDLDDHRVAAMTDRNLSMNARADEDMPSLLPPAYVRTMFKIA